MHYNLSVIGWMLRSTLCFRCPSSLCTPLTQGVREVQLPQKQNDVLPNSGHCALLAIKPTHDPLGAIFINTHNTPRGSLHHPLFYPTGSPLIETDTGTKKTRQRIQHEVLYNGHEHAYG